MSFKKSKYYKVILSISKIPSYILLGIIRGYKLFISPFLPSACRFYPTCSEYSFQAVKKYGFLKGAYYALKRILRCNPHFKGGYDPLK